jgi:dienelactone hydrolase
MTWILVRKTLLTAALILTSLRAGGEVYEWNGAALPVSKINKVAFRAWLPERTERLRGTLVLVPGRHGDGRSMSSETKWQELGSALGFVVMGCMFSDGEPFPYQNDPGGEVSKSINAAVAELAKLSSHPEIEKAPLAFWGISAGSNVSVNYASAFPERVAALGSSKGTFGAGGGTRAGKFDVPMVFAIGQNDKAEWIEESKKNFEIGFRRHAPWTLAVNSKEGHEVGRSLDLIRPFLKAAIEQRLDAKGSGNSGQSVFKSAPLALGTTSVSVTSQRALMQKIDSRNGWLGDPATLDIVPHAAFKGNRAKAIWLPDEATARAWQAYLQ